jgi:uncharacterized protein YyaL (SSP411 family)
MDFKEDNKDKHILNKGISPDLQSSINWYSWGNEAFEKAKAENKPILLSISGSWCHWCHVMDNTTYSDKQVTRTINRDFVPIRVDTDRRPDINARYNLGGWPTTAFLTPEGHIITGATYIPPEKMLASMEEVTELYREDSERIKKEARIRDSGISGAEENFQRKGKRTVARGDGALETETFADLLGFAADKVKEQYDKEYGGFGNSPKFPMFEALELAQVAYLYQGGKDWREIFEQTLHSMYSGGIYDPEEGGFFRYSTTRDWSIPHYEKMLEDNARMLSLLLTSSKLTGDEFFAAAARDVLRYLENNLYLPEREGWAGSQDADEEYYSLPLDERQKREKPRIDRTIYVSWNALLIRSLFKAAVILAEPRWYDLAMKTLNMLKDRCFSRELGMAHYLAEGENEAQIWGLLEDQAAMGLALTAAYQHSGDMKWLDIARELASFCLKKLAREEGAFRDRPVEKEELGKLSRPVYDIENNSLCANWFVEMASLTGEEAYLEKGADIIHAFMDKYRSHSLFSAGLALAAFGVRERGAVIDVVGPHNDLGLLPLHSTALAAFVPPKVVRLLEPEKAAEIGRVEYADIKVASAFACLGRHCFEPATEPAQLEGIIDKMVKERRAHALFTVKETAGV